MIDVARLALYFVAGLSVGYIAWGSPCSNAAHANLATALEAHVR